MGHRLLTTLLTIALTACSASPSASPYVRRGRALRTSAYVVKLEAPTGSGTGFQIVLPSGQRYIMTARHVCDSALLGMLFVEGKPHRVIKKSTKYDLCLVQSLRRSGGMRVALRAPQAFDNAWTLGYPAGVPLQYYEGYQTGQVEVDKNLAADAYSFPAAPGQSGSPILDESGKVIGLLAWRFEFSGTALAVKWSQIREFLH